MSFLSVNFWYLFTLLCLFLSFIKTVKYKHLLLLLFSYIFYGFGDIKFLFLLISLSFVAYYFGLKIQNQIDQENNPKPYLFFGLMILVSILGLFKYYDFFVDSFSRLLHFDSKFTLNLVLPLGISFYIFQAISYLVDIYYRKINSTSLTNVFLYVGFFPQIVCGPIIKAHEFLPQLQVDTKLSKQRIYIGLQLILFGLFKKLVIADRLGVAVDSVYSSPLEYSGVSLLVVAIGYAIQIYCDFSGYSNIAIGVAHILGFNYKKNFNLPYVSSNPSDFWRRWHISLSTWFRDYVYIPLGGNRKGSYRTYFNLFLTLILSGLWHGAAWTFILWGALQGIGVVIHKIIKSKLKIIRTEKSRIIELISIFLTVIWIWLLWVPFRASSIEESFMIVKKILFLEDGINYIPVYALIFAPIILLKQFILYYMNFDNKFCVLKLNRFVAYMYFCFLAVSILVFGYFGNTSFIYARF